MRSRWRTWAVTLGLALALGPAAGASAVYVHNRPLREQITVSGQVYVSLPALLEALKLGWSVEGQQVTVVEEVQGGGGSLPAGPLLLRCGGRSVELQVLRRDGASWVPLRPAAEALGLKVAYSEELGIVDVRSGRLLTEEDEKVTREVEAAREAREAAIQEAWARRREQIQAERKAREEAALAAEGEDGSGEAGVTDEGAPAASGAAEGTFPKELEGKAPSKATRPQARAGGADKSATPKAEAPVGAAEAPAVKAEAPAGAAEAPKPAPKPALVVFNPTALPDYFTGRVAITARIQNNGYAEARGVRATVVLNGPDGRLWSRQVLSRPALAEDEVWNLSASYTHPEGSSIPRGVPQVTVTVTHDGP